MSCVLCPEMVEYSKRNYCSLGNLDLPDSIVRKAKKHKRCPLTYNRKPRRYSDDGMDFYLGGFQHPSFKKGFHE
jgi:hypothetical protein